VTRTARRRGVGRVRAAAFVAAALLTAMSAVWTVPPANAQPSATPGSVVMSVVDVTPNTPVPSFAKRPLDITLSLQNTTPRSLANLTLTSDRGVPIKTQKDLDRAIRKPQPGFSGLSVANFAAPMTVSLAPDATQQVVVHTTTGIPTDAGLCLCADAIYPLYFSLKDTSDSGLVTKIAAVQTYVPAFGKTTPQPVQVSWVWPILDRPHRTTKDDVFTDDDLSSEVAPGGRLEDLLQVVQNVSAHGVAMTLVMDPDLIDELQVMATEKYTVAVPGQTPVPGTGKAAAAAWLQQLRTTLSADSDIGIDFTTFADPDVEALTNHGLTWIQGLAAQAQSRVTAALGGQTPLSDDIAWPTGQTIGLDALTTLARQGTQTVILNDSTLRRHRNQFPQPNALAPIETTAGPTVAAVTSAPIEKYVQPVVEAGGPGLSMLPKLVAEVAVRAVKTVNRSHFVVITPPRYVDPDPAVATRAILATSNTPWSVPLPLRQATSGCPEECAITPVDHGVLQPQQRHHALPDQTFTTAGYLSQSLPGLASLFANDTDAAINLGPMPIAMQRAESSAWEETDPQGSLHASRALQKRVHALINGVHIVRPSNGTYTLTSSNSPLPIAITNTLNVTVAVRVSLNAVGGVPGFTADRIRTQTIPAHTTIQVRIPTHIERTGRIKVRASLSTLGDLTIGRSITLSVHSNALGTVGVVITVVAGVVLVVALLVRLGRRLHRHRASRRAVVAEAPA
jgi:hypothetical protein